KRCLQLGKTFLTAKGRCTGDQSNFAFLFGARHHLFEGCRFRRQSLISTDHKHVQAQHNDKAEHWKSSSTTRMEDGILRSSILDPPSSIFLQPSAARASLWKSRVIVLFASGSLIPPGGFFPACTASTESRIILRNMMIP